MLSALKSEPIEEDTGLPAFMSPATLGELLDGVSVSTLSDWRKTGHGPAWFKVGNLVRYRGSAVQAWIEECERGAGHEV